MVNYITTFQLYMGMVIAGLFTGLGTALGNYLLNRHILTGIKELKNILDKSIKKKSKRK